MSMITTSRDLDAICRRLSRSSYITVDTEFMRETTYWPRLCVVQVAGPDEAAIIDAIPFFVRSSSGAYCVLSYSQRYVAQSQDS